MGFWKFGKQGGVFFEVLGLQVLFFFIFGIGLGGGEGQFSCLEDGVLREEFSFGCQVELRQNLYVSVVLWVRWSFRFQFFLQF